MRLYCTYNKEQAENYSLRLIMASWYFCSSLVFTHVYESFINIAWPEGYLMCDLCSLKANRVAQNSIILFCFASISVLLMLVKNPAKMRIVTVKVENRNILWNAHVLIISLYTCSVDSSNAVLHSRNAGYQKLFQLVFI